MGAKRHVTKLSLGLVWASSLAVILVIATVVFQWSKDGDAKPNDWSLIDVVGGL